jgi:hypothetical protein
MTTTNRRGGTAGHKGNVRDLRQRIVAEYTEMPGLSVTLAQARRLLAIDEPTCTAVFSSLVDRGVLKRTPEGRYVRA